MTQSGVDASIPVCALNAPPQSVDCSLFAPNGFMSLLSHGSAFGTEKSVTVKCDEEPSTSTSTHRLPTEKKKRISKRPVKSKVRDSAGSSSDNDNAFAVELDLALVQMKKGLCGYVMSKVENAVKIEMNKLSKCNSSASADGAVATQVPQRDARYMLIYLRAAHDPTAIVRRIGNLYRILVAEDKDEIVKRTRRINDYIVIDNNGNKQTNVTTVSQLRQLLRSMSYTLRPKTDFVATDSLTDIYNKIRHAVKCTLIEAANENVTNDSKNRSHKPKNNGGDKADNLLQASGKIPPAKPPRRKRTRPLPTPEDNVASDSQKRTKRSKTSVVHSHETEPETVETDSVAGKSHTRKSRLAKIKVQTKPKKADTVARTYVEEETMDVVSSTNQCC